MKSKYIWTYFSLSFPLFFSNQKITLEKKQWNWFLNQWLFFHFHTSKKWKFPIIYYQAIFFQNHHIPSWNLFQIIQATFGNGGRKWYLRDRLVEGWILRECCLLKYRKSEHLRENINYFEIKKRQTHKNRCYERQCGESQVNRSRFSDQLQFA